MISSRGRHCPHGKRLPGGRFNVVHTLTREPAGSSWSGRRGRIDREMITTPPPPSSNVLIFVCGTDGMYEFFGPRRGAFGGVLMEMGYGEGQVVKL